MQDAIRKIAKIGMKCVVRDGEYCVSFVNDGLSGENAAYYTDDPEDAFRTACAMMQTRIGYFLREHK